MEQFLANLGTQAVELAKTLLLAVIVLAVGFKLIKVLTKKLSTSAGMNKLDPSVHSFINSFIGIALKVLLIIMVVTILGVPMTSIIALASSAALAIGLSLQGSLSNLAGGVIILIFRPFKVGDFIVNGAVSGTVTDIGIFYTHITTPDNHVAVVPNSAITNATVENYSMNPLRRLDLNFTTDYSADIETVKAILTEMVEGHDKVLKDPAPMVRLTAHGDSALQFVCRVWVNADDYWEVNFDLLEQVKKAFDEKGISIPYPQLDVHITK